MSKYKVKGLPWSNGIGTNVSDCNTAREVMQKANLAWNVSKCELMAKMPFVIGGDNTISSIDAMNGDFSRNGNIFRTCPNAYATYRTDKNIPLGLVKSKYEVVQNMDAFNFFDEAIGEYKAVWQTAGMFGYGHKIFVSAKLPIKTRVGDDEIDNYLIFSNSHDGTSSITIMIAPVRVICTNMLNSAIKSTDSYIRIRHTESAKGRLDEGARILKIACEHAKDSEQLYGALKSARMSDEFVLQYIANLILSEPEILMLNSYDSEKGYQRVLNKEYLTLEKTKISVRKANQIAAIYDYYFNGIGQTEILGTAWGAYNAMTGYYSNVSIHEGERRMDNLLYGTGNTAMQKALIDAYNISRVASRVA